MECNQFCPMAFPQNPSAAARTQPVSLRPILRQDSKIVDDILLLLRDSQDIGIGFYKAFFAVGAFTEWPFSGFLKPVLP